MLTSLLRGPGSLQTLVSACCGHWPGLPEWAGHHRKADEASQRNESDSNLLHSTLCFQYSLPKGRCIVNYVLAFNRRISSLLRSRSDVSSREMEFLKVFFAICTLKDMRRSLKTGPFKDHCCAFFEIHSRSALKQRLIVVITDIQSG